jgi:hypothetical protein
LSRKDDQQLDKRQGTIRLLLLLLLLLVVPRFVCVTITCEIRFEEIGSSGKRVTVIRAELALCKTTAFRS